MTTTRAILLTAAASFALVGCEFFEDKATDTATVGTGTSTGTATGTATGTGTGTGSTPTSEIDCADGVDNDMDGLLDCEDDECAADPACFEADCADAADNDNDGLTDCADEDCWGNGCEITIATLTGMNIATAQSRQTYSYGVGGPTCNTYNYGIGIDIQLLSPVGTVRHLPASGGTWTTCNWNAISSTMAISGGYPSTVGAVPVGRNGFTIDSGCAIQTSGFLPGYWRLNGSSPVQFQTRPSGNGPVWWTLNPSGSYTQASYSTSTVIPGSPCSIQQYQYSYVGTWFDVDVGSDYTMSNP